MTTWIMHCEEKNKRISTQKERFSQDFDSAIKEIEDGNFLIILRPNKNHHNQKSFLIEINNYPYIVPFKIRGKIIHLITMFPDRRYKNAKF